jgi:hypothetical protein
MLKKFFRRFFAPKIPIDPRTGRPFGDHGTGAQAIEFALDHTDHDLGNMEAFLIAWREGGAFEEWPEFYTWLKGEDHAASRPEA